MQDTNDKSYNVGVEAHPKTALDALVTLGTGLLAYFLGIIAVTGMAKLTWFVMRITWEYLP